jgi:HK97 family phage prohead protease
MEVKFLSLDMKAADGGEVEGYGSVFGGLDSYGDTIEPGAFAKSIAKRKPKMLWQHRADKPIGVWDDVVEDGNGLRLRGRLALGTDQGREAHELTKMGALDGLSIGFKTVAHTPVGNTRLLKEVELWEVSFVTFPADEAARVASIKSVADASFVEQRLLEAFRLSRTEAKVFMARGFKGLLDLREAGEAVPDDALREAEAVKTQLATLLERIGR